MLEKSISRRQFVKPSVLIAGFSGLGYPNRSSSARTDKQRRQELNHEQLKEILQMSLVNNSY